MTNLFENAQIASQALARIPEQTNQDVLLDFAKRLRKHQADLLAANRLDLEAMTKSDTRYDRLLLNESRIESMAQTVESVAHLPSPCGIILEEITRPNGLNIQRVSVPLGVVGMIYEARPNVTADAFALCFRSSNACILKGGKEAQHSNTAIVNLIHQALKASDLDVHCAVLLPAERSATQALLEADKFVDVIIPRGSQQLIDYVRENARVPVIETGAGVVHTYFDKYGDLTKGKAIIDNAKTRRVSVCNALDTLLIHQDRLEDLPALLKPLRDKGVEICEEYGCEFLSMKMSVRVVANLEGALEHIQRYGSKHSEAIITEDKPTAEQFLQQVDAAAVYVNASTAFTDGGEFGLGAEIGISTQKLHARGPFALKALTSYKWLIRGQGQIRV
jgi:glutamate-5-semialdehyde dehydrogenase